MATLGEFDGRDGIDLAAGVVRGARSWEIDRLGRLRAVNYDFVWRPGENVAKCMRRAYALLPAPTTMTYTDPNGNQYLVAAGGVSNWSNEPMKPTGQAQEPEHQMKGCQCGFYAYYEGSDDYRNGHRVSGVIEGYGETMIGTRGFRAEKARIVALCVSKKTRVIERRVAQVRRNYPEIPFFTSFKKMIAEFPPDASLEITPENDPTFWDRRA